MLPRQGGVRLVRWRTSRGSPTVVLGIGRLSKQTGCVREVWWRARKWPPAMVWSWRWKCSPWRICWCVDCFFLQVAAVWMYLLYVEMCVESPVKGVVRLVLNGWCGYGEFIFNLQPCGYLWRGMKSQCVVRLWRALLQLAVMWVPLERPNLSAWCGSFNAWCGCLHFFSQWFSSRPRMVPLHPLIFRFNKVGMYSSSPWQGE